MEQFFQRLFDGSPGGVNLNAWIGPGAIVAIQHILPGRRLEAGDVDLTILNSSAMFARIRTHDFDIDERCACVFGGLTPGVASKLPRVDGVGDDVVAEAQIFFSGGIADHVTQAADVFDSALDERCLDRVGSEINRIQARCKTLGERRFASPGQAGEDDENWL